MPAGLLEIRKDQLGLSQTAFTRSITGAGPMDLPAIQVIERLPYAVIHFENRGFRQPGFWG